MKYAAKLLTMSDLTLFAAYYKNHSTAKQKGINLNGNVLADTFYPALPASVSGTGERPITLDIYGPHGAGLQRQQRKIVKSPGAKNWRLNGKLIETPTSEEGRYAGLAEGDVAVLAFDGAAGLPDAVSMVILSAASSDDLPVLEAIRDALALKKRQRAMAPMDLAQLIGFSAKGPAGHPLRLLLPDPERDRDLAEAGGGDIEAADRLVKRVRSGSVRPISAAELEAALARAQEVGRAGEILISAHLDRRSKSGDLAAFEWASEKNAVSPFDFLVDEKAGQQAWDVKSTTGKFLSPFHISAGELRAAAESVDYRIARVFDVDTDEGAKFKLSDPIRDVAENILSALDKLPLGIAVGSVQVDPKLIIGWSHEIDLPAADDDEDD